MLNKHLNHCLLAVLLLCLTGNAVHSAIVTDNMGSKHQTRVAYKPFPVLEEMFLRAANLKGRYANPEFTGIPAMIVFVQAGNVNCEMVARELSRLPLAVKLVPAAGTKVSVRQNFRHFYADATPEEKNGAMRDMRDAASFIFFISHDLRVPAYVWRTPRGKYLFSRLPIQNVLRLAQQLAYDVQDVK